MNDLATEQLLADLLAYRKALLTLETIQLESLRSTIEKIIDTNARIDQAQDFLGDKPCPPC